MIKIREKVLKPAAQKVASPVAGALAELQAALTATVQAALVEHDAKPVAKSIQAKLGDALTKKAVDLGILARLDSPQHDVEAELPTSAPSEYQAQIRRSRAFIVSLARDQEAGRFGPKE